VVGSLWLLIENGFLKGTDGSNRFGDDPLDVDEAPSRTAPTPARQPKKAKATAATKSATPAVSADQRFAATDGLLVGVMVLGAAMLAWLATRLL